MRWTTSIPFVILLTLGYYTRLVAGFHLTLQQPESIEDTSYLDRNSFSDYEFQMDQKHLEDERLKEAIRVLSKLLIIPWPNGESPLIYIESAKKPLNLKFPNFPDDEDVKEDLDQTQTTNDNRINPAPSKRMRYYRKYPWKRENSGYYPENHFICYPSKQEVHRLLVALHDHVYGVRNSAIDFCNRKRPAHTIMYNIMGGK